MDIALDEGPTTVRLERLARPMVEFDGGTQSKAGRLESKIEASGSGEQTNHGRCWH